MSEGEGYITAQRSAARLPAKNTEQLTANFLEGLIEKGIPPGLAQELAELKVAGKRAEAREKIRQAAQIGEERKRLGWSPETIDHNNEVELLRLFHSSRRKGQRRKEQRGSKSVRKEKRISKRTW